MTNASANLVTSPDELEMNQNLGDLYPDLSTFKSKQD